jgi:signal transduction histidine kinase
VRCRGDQGGLPRRRSLALGLGVLRTEEAEDAIPLALRPTLGDIDGLVGHARRADVEVAVQRRGEQRPLDAMAERAAYRVVQETLTNAGKHAPGARRSP